MQPEAPPFAAAGTVPSTPHILILGGGFSGTLLAVHLLRKTSVPLRLTVVNHTYAPGRGVAYSTHNSALLLNVPTGRMSALANEPSHFVDWLRTRDARFGPDDFVPRNLFGDYVSELFTNTCNCYTGATVDWVEDEAQALHVAGNAVEVELRRGARLQADLAVLATGTPPPPVPLLLQKLDKQLLANHAWEQGAFKGIPPEGRVLVLGTGLTAVDQIAALTEQGFRGSILLLSRRGLLPAAQLADTPSWGSEWTEALPPELNNLVTAVRQQIQLADQQQVDWRAVIDTLRPKLPALWAKLSRKDRSRFLRHVQVHWDTARHRMPPQLSVLVQLLLEKKRLVVAAGNLLTAERYEQQVLIQYRERGQNAVHTTRVDKVINCIGTSSILGPHAQLISQLLEDGLAVPDSVGLGIQTDSDGAVIGKAASSDPRLYAIGPLRKASAWETTAVAEIRVQAAELADTLLQKVNIQSHNKRCTGPDA